MNTSLSYQKGVVLIVSLVFLAILTIIGTAGLQSTITAEKLALNTEDMNIAFQSAEASISRVETWIRNIRATTNAPPPAVCNANDGSGGLQAPGCDIINNIYIRGGIPENELNNPLSDFWTSTAPQYATEDAWVLTNNSEISQAPRYAIEILSQQPYDLSEDAVEAGTGIYFYRITALGFGALPSTRVLLQSIITENY